MEATCTAMLSAETMSPSAILTGWGIYNPPCLFVTFTNISMFWHEIHDSDTMRHAFQLVYHLFM
jgi:hypothetical protein